MVKYLKNSFLIIVLIIHFSCNQRSEKLEFALKFAEDNRIELEKVLDFYSKDLKDSLKYKAACFLIENMPYHEYYESEALDSIKYNVYPYFEKGKLYPEIITNIERLYGKPVFNEYNLKNDAQTITSDYLINNIEWAFKVWEESPWKDRISLDQFCEEILPYRVRNEKPEYWREQYYNKFKPVLDSLLIDNDPVSACQILYDYLVNEMKWYYADAKTYPGLGANIFLNSRYGSCDDQSDFMTFVMRSVGIPGGTDFYIINPIAIGGGHSWNYVKDNDGKCYEFLFDSFGPLSRNEDLIRKKGAVYRRSFVISENILFSKLSRYDIPLILRRNKNLKNVTSEYFPNTQTNIKVDSLERVVYLSVLQLDDLYAITWSFVNEGLITFDAIEPDIVFFPTYCINQKMIPACDPFYKDKNGKCHFLKPEEGFLRTVTLTRKYPMSATMHLIKNFILGGKFEGANNLDFSDAETIFVINEKANMKYCEIDENTKPYRYIRYLSGENGFNCMAELEFYGTNNKLLSGSVIGTDGTRWGDSTQLKFAVFDKKPLTFYLAKEPSGSWVGLDFGRENKITKIRYLFRNDDNSIRNGDLYELFYYKHSGWVSLGKKYGTKEQALTYNNVPNNALLRLKNHTRGREESAFVTEDGEQIW